MDNCLFCGAGVIESMLTCGACGAPIKKVVTSVVIDLSGVRGKIRLSITKAPALIPNMLPSRLFDLTFESQSAVLMYRGPKTGNRGNGGAIAQGTNAVAVGAGGIHIGGNVTGSIIANGHNNKIISNGSSPLPQDETTVVGIFLPVGISYIVINGNGKTDCVINYSGAEVIPQNANV